MFRKITLSVTLLLFGAAAVAQNPIIRDQFSADPSALVVGDKIYVFPSHDILAPDDYRARGSVAGLPRFFRRKPDRLDRHG